MKKRLLLFLLPMGLLLQSCSTLSLRGTGVLSDNSSYSSVIMEIGTDVGEKNQINTTLALVPSGVDLGLGYIHFFSMEKRFQPFAGFDYVGCFNGEYHVTPNVGLRYFLSNRIALTGSMGYQLGWWSEYLSEDVKFRSGFSPAVGITFVLRQKKD